MNTLKYHTIIPYQYIPVYTKTQFVSEYLYDITKNCICLFK